MFKSNYSSESLRPTFGLALSAVASMAILSAGFSIASAQAVSTQSAAAPVAAQPALNLQAPAVDTSNAQLFSSSSDNADATEASLNPAPVNFANYMQYGGGQRRRYGQPRYRGSNTNADGSPKYTFFAGVGLAQPVGNTWHYLTPSYGFGFGGGRNFNAKVGVLLDFDYDHFGFTGQTLSNQSYIYFDDSNPSDSGFDGSSHIWSFTVNPTYNFYQGKTWGGYGVVGVGFYHKVANFTTPQVACLDPYCFYQGYVNSTFDHYTSNAPGFNGGFGITYKFSRFSNERFYAEARYVFIDNSQRQGYTVFNSSYSSSGVFTSTYNGNDAYPANSNKTTYVPIKVGLRF